MEILKNIEAFMDNTSELQVTTVGETAGCVEAFFSFFVFVHFTAGQDMLIKKEITRDHCHTYLRMFGKKRCFGELCAYEAS